MSFLKGAACQKVILSDITIQARIRCGDPLCHSVDFPEIRAGRLIEFLFNLMIFTSPERHMLLFQS